MLSRSTYQAQLAALTILGFTSMVAQIAPAQELPPASAHSSRLIPFDHPDADAPNLEVNVSGPILDDLFGLGAAALEGVAEGLLQADADSPTNKTAAAQVGAIREMVGLVRGAVDEARVRIYSDRESVPSASEIAQHYSAKLAPAGWEPVVRMKSDRESIAVLLQRTDGALRGLFVVVGDGSELVLVNAACDISPERLKHLTKRATVLALEMGAAEELHRAMAHLQKGPHRKH